MPRPVNTEKKTPYMKLKEENKALLEELNNIKNQNQNMSEKINSEVNSDNTKQEVSNDSVTVEMTELPPPEFETNEPTDKEQEDEKKIDYNRIHPYMQTNVIINNLLTKVLKVDVNYTKEEFIEINSLFWDAFPEPKGLTPKQTLFITIGSVYASKFNLI